MNPICAATLPRLVAIVLVPVIAAFSVATARAQDPAQTALHLLDYIAVDYAEAVEAGKIKNVDEYREMREFVREARSMLERLPANAAHAQLRADAIALERAIAAKSSADDVATKARDLRWAVIEAYQLQTAPRRPPELARAAALYADQCAACHGATGHGDGPAAGRLSPPPSNFHDAERMASRSAYGLYNTITLGVGGTAMAPYRHLSEDERWALAFHVANFAAAKKELAAGAALWERGQGRERFGDFKIIATLSPNEVRARFGDDTAAVQAYLRAHPNALDVAKREPIAYTLTTLGESLAAYRAGRRAEASRLAVQAYLEGFEPLESRLSRVDAALTARTERAMMAYRALLQDGAPIEQAQAQAATVQALLAQAREALEAARWSPATTFSAALVIVLREGAEAILVIAAMLALLVRAGATHARRWVHVGWIAALAAGFGTWLVSSYVVRISGAGREITEGVTTLAAAAMLLYVGYWLHSKAHTAAWQKYIADKVNGALSRGTVGMLVLISFLAVYREAFETVLFYQTLSVQVGIEGRGALFAGLLVGAALLVIIAWAILRASARLSIGWLFSASAVVLVVLAIVFTGQGIAALQEAGEIGVDPVAFIAVPALGIYPTLQTLAAQMIVVALSVVVLWRASRRARSARADATEDTAHAR